MTLKIRDSLIKTRYTFYSKSNRYTEVNAFNSGHKRVSSQNFLKPYVLWENSLIYSTPSSLQKISLQVFKISVNLKLVLSNDFLRLSETDQFMKHISWCLNSLFRVFGQTLVKTVSPASGTSPEERGFTAELPGFLQPLSD